MAVYIPMIMVVTLLSYLAMHVRKNQRIILIVVSLIIPVMVAMFRYNNGADYLMYLRMMKLAEVGGSFTTSFTSLKSIEVGYWYLLKICGFLWPRKYYLTYGLIALIICGFCYAAIWQQSKNPMLSIFLFFAAGIYFDSFNGLRQYIAVAIVVFAYKYIETGELKKYLIAVAIAFLFHYSAVIVIPAYFIRDIKMDFKKVCAIAGGCLVGGTVLFNIVSFLLSFTRYKYFLTSVEYEIQVTSSSILYTTVISVVTFGYITIKKVKVSQQFQYMMNFQILPWCAALLSLSIPLAWRVQYYFMFFEILYIPAFLREVRSKRMRLLFAAIFIVMYVVAVSYGMTQNEWYDAIPYHFYFDYM